MGNPTDQVLGASPPRGPLRLEVRTDAGALGDLGSAWDLLVARTSGAHPYLTGGWVRAWWRSFGRGPRRRASRSRLHVVTVWHGDDLVGLLPMASVRVGAGAGSLRVLVGVGQENADYGGALVADGFGGAWEELAAHLLDELGRGRTIVNLTRLPDGDPLLAALERAAPAAGAALRTLEDQQYPRLDLDALEDPAGHIARLLRRNDVLRRSRRLAERGEVRWTSHHPDAAGAGLETFFALHDLRWAGRHATGPFAREPGRTFIRDAAAELEAAGLLRLSVLTVDDAPVAARFSTIVGGWGYGMKSGWDPAWASMGPGHVLVGRLLQDAVAEGWHGVDLLRGEGRHKDVWATSHRRVRYWALVRDDRFAGLDQQVLRALTSARYRWRDGGRPAPSVAGPR